jgi:putative FmdB family regulatory protein
VPTYAYACNTCGHEFEVVQSMSDAALTACPSCSGPLRKVFHPVGVTFKGSGFYRTDSRAGSSSTPAATDGKPAGGASDSKGASKPDTKPAKKETSSSSSSSSSGSSSSSTASSGGSGS